MAHGRNNPTGNIGFSPLLITLFAPLAFMAKAWLTAVLGGLAVVVFLIVLLFFKHVRDVAEAKEEQRVRESLGL